MSRETLSLAQAAEHVHVAANELRHVAQRGEVEAVQHGGDWWFEHRALDEWAQRNVLAANARALESQHRAMAMEEGRGGGGSLASVLNAAAIELDLAAKGKAGALADLVAIAERSGLVYDAEALHRELVDREAAASTAVAGSVALPHPRFHDPYLFEQTFVAYARSARGIFFGAPDDEPTRHFFLVCSTDHERHLHMLARLAMLVLRTDLVDRLDAAEDAAAVVAAVAACEETLRRR